MFYKLHACYWNCLCIIESSIIDALSQLHQSNDCFWHKIIYSCGICPKYRKDFILMTSTILPENTTCHTSANVLQYRDEIRFSFFFFFFSVQRCISVWMQVRWILIKFRSSFCEDCHLIYIGFLELHTF